MNSNIELRIIPSDGSVGKVIDKFIDYEVDYDLFTADGAFAVNLIPDTSTQIEPGDIAELVICGERVLKGWVEKVNRKYDNKNRSYSVYGRSISSILIDNAVLPDGGMWAKHTKQTVSGMCKKLLSQIHPDYRPNIDTSVIVSEGATLDIEITPGESYWDVLTRIATSRGLFIASLPDGNLALLTLQNSYNSGVFAIESGSNYSNIIESDITYDETQRYANIIVISQNNTTTDSTVINDNMAVFPRTIVINPEQDGLGIDKFGNLHKAKQIKDCRRFEYTVAGHDQTGNVWTVGASGDVNDQINGVMETLLITGVRFTLSKQEGQRTIVKLSPLLRY